VSGLANLRYIFLLLAVVLLLSACEKEHDDVVSELEYTNPFDADNPETHGNPYNLTTEITEDGVKLQWTDIPIVDGMKVYRSAAVDGDYVEVGSSTTGIYTDTDTDPGTTYYYQLRAYSGDDTAPSSPAVHIFVPDNVPPEEPYEPPDEPDDMITGKDGARIALIPAGEFQMGDHFNEGERNELPVHTVYVDAFYMDIHEVTHAQYQKFMEATGHSAPAYWSDPDFNAPEQPVVGVSWHDAVAYAEWAGKRLPTEAEWEKAARGGLSVKRFPWGDSDPDGTQCNFADMNTDYDWSDDSVDDGYEYTAPVDSYLPNGYGLYDMAGNVWEWCADWYDSGYYANSPNDNPLGPDSGTYRVLRGESWRSNPHGLRAAHRIPGNPTLSYYNAGFRCVSQD